MTNTQDIKLNTSQTKEYQVFLIDQSYFGGKFQSYMRYKEIPHTVHQLTFMQWWKTYYKKTGLMKMPFAQAPDGTWLQDTTPMLEWLEKKHTDHSIMPEDPFMQFFCRLIEDYADEWHWRPAMHYRWSYHADATVNSIRFRDSLLTEQPGPDWLNSLLAKVRQRAEYVKGDGVTDRTWSHVESIYLRTLDWMEAILKEQPFLLGDKPSLIDFGFIGPMFKHYGIDPTPARIMRDRAPNVYAWVARVWASKGSDFADKDWNYTSGELPESLKPFVKDICEAYLPYLLANARAWDKREPKCSYTVQGVTYKDTKTYDYRVWCREQLFKHFSELPEKTRNDVEKILREYGGWDTFTADQHIASGLDPEGIAPIRKAIAPDKKLDLLTYFRGTPWNTSERRV